MEIVVRFVFSLVIAEVAISLLLAAIGMLENILNFQFSMLFGFVLFPVSALVVSVVWFWPQLIIAMLLCCLLGRMRATSLTTWMVAAGITMVSFLVFGRFRYEGVIPWMAYPVAALVALLMWRFAQSRFSRRDKPAAI